MLKQTLQRLGASSTDKRRFVMLLSPSWSGGVLCGVLGLAVAASVLVSAHFNGSFLEQAMKGVRSLNSDSDLSSYGGSNGLTYDSIMSTAVTLTFWALVGVAVYFLFVGIFTTIQKTHQFRQELGYINHSRDHYVWAAVFRLGLRAAVLTLWFWYFTLFFKVIVPSCLLWVYAAAYSLTPSGACSVALALLVMTTALHVHVVLLRLLALRPRLFGDTPYA